MDIVTFSLDKVHIPYPPPERIKFFLNYFEFFFACFLFIHENQFGWLEYYYLGMNLPMNDER